MTNREYLELYVARQNSMTAEQFAEWEEAQIAAEFERHERAIAIAQEIETRLAAEMAGLSFANDYDEIEERRLRRAVIEREVRAEHRRDVREVIAMFGRLQ